MRGNCHITSPVRLRAIRQLFGAPVVKALAPALVGLGFVVSVAAAMEAQHLAALEAESSVSNVSTGMVTANTLQVLSDSDANRYAHVFKLQKDGEWDKADAIIARIGDKQLMGHVLYQRYMHPTLYKSTYEELQRWMVEYADHPGASKVYLLAKRRQGKGAEPLDRPIRPKSMMNFADVAPADAPRMVARHSADEQKQINRIHRTVRDELSKGRMAEAEALLQSAEVREQLNQGARDELQAQIAGGWFFHGDDKRAFRLASEAADRSRERTYYADWIAGLAAWRMKNIPAAQKHFDALANSKVASSWNLSAGAFWAARAHLVGGKPDKVLPLLRKAAANPRTFYGLIAARQLGLELKFDWTPPYLTYDLHRRLEGIPAVQRAIALVQAGEHRLADQEIRAVYLSADNDLGQALLAIAYRLELPAMQLRLARGVRGPKDRRYDGALYPVPPWQPGEGFQVDQALLYAFMRQESAFDAGATSWVGARGLMQLMPHTASFVANDRSLKRQNKAKLFDPEFNVDLGQKYLAYLLEHEAVKGELFKLAVAYNAGPGSLQRWLAEIDYDGDPLTFIESIPSRETRVFVEKVLSNFWIYRERMQQDSPSLDAIASGHAPIYLSLDAATVKVAENARR